MAKTIEPELNIGANFSFAFACDTTQTGRTHRADVRETVSSTTVKLAFRTSPDSGQGTITLADDTLTLTAGADITELLSLADDSAHWVIDVESVGATAADVRREARGIVLVSRDITRLSEPTAAANASKLLTFSTTDGQTLTSEEKTALQTKIGVTSVDTSGFIPKFDDARILAQGINRTHVWFENPATPPTDASNTAEMVIFDSESPRPQVPNFGMTVRVYDNNADDTQNVVYRLGSTDTTPSNGINHKWWMVREQHYIPGITGPQFEFYEEHSRPEWLSGAHPVRRIGFGMTGNATEGAASTTGSFEVRPYDTIDFDANGKYAFLSKTAGTAEFRLYGDGFKEFNLTQSTTTTTFFTGVPYVSFFVNTKRIDLGACLIIQDTDTGVVKNVSSSAPVRFTASQQLTQFTPEHFNGIGVATFGGVNRLSATDNNGRLARLPQIKDWDVGDGTTTFFQFYYYGTYVVLGPLIEVATGAVINPSTVCSTFKVENGYVLMIFSSAPTTNKYRFSVVF